jgi:hypothetical protein
MFILKENNAVRTVDQKHKLNREKAMSPKSPMSPECQTTQQ